MILKAQEGRPNGVWSQGTHARGSLTITPYLFSIRSLCPDCHVEFNMFPKNTEKRFPIITVGNRFFFSFHLTAVDKYCLNPGVELKGVAGAEDQIRVLPRGQGTHPVGDSADLRRS